VGSAVASFSSLSINTLRILPFWYCDVWWWFILLCQTKNCIRLTVLNDSQCFIVRAWKFVPWHSWPTRWTCYLNECSWDIIKLIRKTRYEISCSRAFSFGCFGNKYTNSMISMWNKHQATCKPRQVVQKCADGCRTPDNGIILDKSYCWEGGR